MDIKTLSDRILDEGFGLGEASHLDNTPSNLFTEENGSKESSFNHNDILLVDKKDESDFLESYETNFADNSDSLEHYGILGMKWGVRRTPEELGHRTRSGLSNEERPKFEKAKKEYKEKTKERDSLKAELDAVEDEIDIAYAKMSGLPFDSEEFEKLGDEVNKLDAKADDIADKVVGLDYDIKKVVGDNRDLFRKANFDVRIEANQSYDRSKLSRDEKVEFRRIRKEFEATEKEYDKLDDKWFKLDKKADKIKDEMKNLGRDDPSYFRLKALLNKTNREMSDIDVQCVKLDEKLWKLTEDNDELFRKAKYPGGGKIDHSDMNSHFLAHYFNENISDNELTHYGVLGMKWGVRKDRDGDQTSKRKKKDRRYEDESDQEYQSRMQRESQERIAKTQAKERLMTQKRALKSQEKIQRMQIQAQKEQRQLDAKNQQKQKKLDQEERKRQAELAAKEAKERRREEQTNSKPTKVRNLTDQELNAAIQRLRNEQTYKQLSLQNKSLPKKTVIKAATIGGGILLAVGTAVAKKQLTDVGNQKVSSFLEKKGYLEKGSSKNQQQKTPSMEDIQNLINEAIKNRKD